jgi:hypothetical protein
VSLPCWLTSYFRTTREPRPWFGAFLLLLSGSRRVRKCREDKESASTKWQVHSAAQCKAALPAWEREFWSTLCNSLPSCRRKKYSNHLSSSSRNIRTGLCSHGCIHLPILNSRPHCHIVLGSDQRSQAAINIASYLTHACVNMVEVTFMMACMDTHTL